ncbi:MAG: hypothetical protein D6790_13700 [Caldilineae bacterium]|nr:MAG: hypothetical protein D6790_13700 [Caldilineae bacterium]
MADDSKPIRKGDDASKNLIMELLDGQYTYGFDVDSIYFLEKDQTWIVLEFLKTDHQRVRPKDSHPHRYWRRNWRKFASLWRLVTHLSESGARARLFLVNYEDLSHAQMQGRAEREFHIIEVREMDATEQGGIKDEKTWTTNFDRFQQWFQRLNRRAR